MNKLAELLAKGWEEVKSVRGTMPRYRKSPDGIKLTFKDAWLKEFGGAGNGGL